MPSPIVTATTQAAGLSAMSNLCAQFLTAYQAQRPFILDPVQLARFVFFTLTNAPLNWLWQQFLERSFPGYPTSSRVSKQDLEKGGIAKSGTIQGQEGRITKPKLNLRNTFIKWFVDCMCLGALFNTVSFLVMMGLMKGESFELIKKNLETNTIPIILASYRIWPIASLISFSCIPVERRIVFLSFVGLLWGIYVSMLAAKI